MTLPPATAAEIRRLYFAEHWKRGTIAVQLGVHFDVVVRILGSFGPKAGTPRPEARVLEPYIPFIDETLERYPKLVSTRIHDMIAPRGYAGSLRTLRRYVRSARPAPKSEVFLRVETLPGEQAQVDWAHVGSIPVPGGQRPLWAFVMVLAYSRAMWAELVIDMSAASLRRSLVRASAFFGGSPRQWLFDNAKTVVVERSGDAIRFHPSLIELAAQMHVQPALCAPRKPQEKGKVERAIRFLKDRFFAARSFHSLAHGNAQLAKFFVSISDARPHPRWPDRRVADLFEEERPRLLALPDPLPEIHTLAPASVDKRHSFASTPIGIPYPRATRAVRSRSSRTIGRYVFWMVPTKWHVTSARGVGTRSSSSASIALLSSRKRRRLAISRAVTVFVSSSPRLMFSLRAGSMQAAISDP